MKQIQIIFISLAMLTGCAHRITTNKISQNSSFTGSFFYALPRNTLNFEVKVQKTVYERGKNFNANDSMCDIVQKYGVEMDLFRKLVNNTSLPPAYKILENDMVMTTAAIVDPNKIYSINVDPKFFTDNTVGLSFTKDYLLTEATVTQENRSAEIAISTFSNLLGVVSTFNKGTEAFSKNDSCSRLNALDSALRDHAEYTLRTILPSSPEIYQDAKKYLQSKVIENFEKKFYSTKVTTYTVYFQIDVDTAWVGKTIELFRIDSTDGALLINDPRSSVNMSSSPHRLRRANTPDKSGWYHIKIDENKKDVNSHISSFDQKLKGETGLVYNVPATAEISVWTPDNKKCLLSQRQMIAQLGKTASLNPKFTKAAITLDPLTGALLKASGESKAITASNISSAGSAVSKGVEMVKPSEIDELEKKAKLLELKEKIKKLESGNQTP